VEEKAMTGEEYDKLEREFEELIRTPLPLAKPMKRLTFAVMVSNRLAAAIKANPETVRVRVSANGVDGVAVVDKPQRVVA
jgi:hypothetical protein